jgi:hypothetical protein
VESNEEKCFSFLEKEGRKELLGSSLASALDNETPYK